MLWGLTVVALGGCSDSSSAPQAATPLPEPESKGAHLVLTYCSACHGPPQPTTHSADEWPAVAERMQQRRAVKGFPPVPGPDLGEIVGYMQRYARAAR